MKKILIAVCSILTLSACTNDEELYVPDPIEVGIEGTWKLTSILVETPVDLNGDGTSSNDFIVESDCYTNETLVFNPDMTGLNVSTSYLSLTVNVDFPTDATITSECILEDETVNFTWTQNGNNIVFTDETGSYPGTLANNKLTITIPNGQIYFDNELNVVLMEDLTLVYTK